jgi:hypothetical protein
MKVNHIAQSAVPNAAVRSTDMINILQHETPEQRLAQFPVPLFVLIYAVDLETFVL